MGPIFRGTERVLLNLVSYFQCLSKGDKKARKIFSLIIKSWAIRGPMLQNVLEKKRWTKIAHKVGLHVRWIVLTKIIYL